MHQVGHASRVFKLADISGFPSIAGGRWVIDKIDLSYRGITLQEESQIEPKSQSFTTYCPNAH